jgi:hypothetical protein
VWFPIGLQSDNPHSDPPTGKVDTVAMSMDTIKSPTHGDFDSESVVELLSFECRNRSSLNSLNFGPLPSGRNGSSDNPIGRGFPWTILWREKSESAR